MFLYVRPLSMDGAVNGSLSLFTNGKKYSSALTSSCLERQQAALVVIRSRWLARQITVIWSKWPTDSWNNNRETVSDRRNDWRIKSQRKLEQWKRIAAKKKKRKDGTGTGPQTAGFISDWGESGEVENWRISPEKRKWPHAGWSFWGHAECPCLPCPQRGPRRTFLKCLTTPQAASKPAAAELLFHWLKVIQYLSTYWCVLFEGEIRRNIFLPHTAPQGKIINSPCFVSPPFIVTF